MKITAKILLIIAILFCIPLLAQNENPFRSSDDIWEDFYPTGLTDSTGFMEDDVIYMVGGDSLYLFIPTWRSLGVMWFHGYVTGVDTLFSANYDDYDGVRDTVAFQGTDTVYFELAPHTGTGKALNSYEAETYTAFDTAAVTTVNGTGAFSFWPMSNTTFKNQGCRYYTLLIHSTANSFSGIKFKIEWIDSFKK